MVKSQSLLSPKQVPMDNNTVVDCTSPNAEILGPLDTMETQELTRVLQITPENAEDSDHPCASKTCKFRNSSAQIRQCAAYKFGCDKFIHSFCYGNFLAKNQLESLIHPDDETPYCVCSKRCYNKVKHALANNTYYSPNDTTRLGWENDGRNGTNDINNSMKLLLDWMGENGALNYTRF
jgi:hypothetical protein